VLGIVNHPKFGLIYAYEVDGFGRQIIQMITTFIDSFIHSLIHSIIQSIIHSLIHSFFQSFYAMDDANIPSLLSLPYLGWISEYDVVYQRTRKYLLSKWNPYYFQGSAARGIGSPHTGIVRHIISYV
jgi:hypothetical protein